MSNFVVFCLEAAMTFRKTGKLDPFLSEMKIMSCYLAELIFPENGQENLPACVFFLLFVCLFFNVFSPGEVLSFV